MDKERICEIRKMIADQPKWDGKNNRPWVIMYTDELEYLLNKAERIQQEETND